MAKMRNFDKICCPICKLKPILINEVYIITGMQFKFSKDGILEDVDKFDGHGSPFKLVATCENTHTWRLSNCSSISDIQYGLEDLGDIANEVVSFNNRYGLYDNQYNPLLHQFVKNLKTLGLSYVETFFNSLQWKSRWN